MTSNLGVRQLAAALGSVLNQSSYQSGGEREVHEDGPRFSRFPYLKVCRSLAAVLLLAVSFLTPFLVRADDTADDKSPFVLAVTLQTNLSPVQVSVAITVPAQHHVYADKLSFSFAGTPATFNLPKPISIKDRFTSEQKMVFETNIIASAALPKSDLENLPLTIRLQGCNEESCFFPEEHTFLIRGGKSVSELTGNTNAPAPPETQNLIAGLRITKRASGYVGSTALLKFLQESPTQGVEDGSAADFVGWKRFLVLASILLGGLALDLTPCVLPLVPITLAILGAGSKSPNQRQGFARGGAYGLGMALAYGVLGLVVVLTGAKFGTLNSSPWFNFAIAAIFILLGLSMFDLLSVDFSRFKKSSVGPRKPAGNPYVVAASMGAVSALLAGACVAPVVITMLLLASNLHAQGVMLGLALPFILGIGMALPWPFAGAGLSFLPKPGAWMVRVKQVFGVGIFAFSLFYAYEGYKLSGLSDFLAGGAPKVTDTAKAVADLRAGLLQAVTQGKPAFVDFWASWCKNCSAMEHTTFKDPKVQQELQKFVVIKFQAERPGDPAIKAVLDQFGAFGLPSYVLLTPTASEEESMISSPLPNPSKSK